MCSRPFLALFLIVFGLNMVCGISIPPWATGILALIAGILIAMESYRLRVEKK